MTYFLFEYFLIVTLEEITSRVGKHARFEYNHAIYICLYYVHQSKFLQPVRSTSSITFMRY